MIIVAIMGGLGNQLFQYAVGRALSYKFGYDLVLDTRWFKNNQTVTQRKYKLHHYPITARLLNKQEKKWAMLNEHPFLRQLSINLCRWKYYYERDTYVFDEQVLHLPDNNYLYGYWQSYKYFEEINDIIRQEFNLLTPMGDMDNKTAEKINDTNAISLHIRRGDYLLKPIERGLCSLAYYQKAVDFLNQRVEAPHYFVFSDDHEWVIKNLKIPAQTTYIIHNNEENAFQDLRLMSLCRHHIMANSSFSWWGSWLNHKQGKIVIAPNRWLGKNATADLIPSNWITMSNFG